MKALRDLLKWFIIVLVTLVLTVITVILADWPLWASVIVFVIYLCIILIIAHLIRKKIYQYRTGFIQQESKSELAEANCYARLKKIEKQLVDGHHTNLSKQLNKMPWILNFDLSNHTAHSKFTQYALVTTQTENQHDDGARWYVLENMAVVSPERSVYENILSNDYWIKFLEEIRKFRSDAPFNKITISLSIQSLIGEVSSALLDQLTILKSRIEQVFEFTGYVIPVCFIFTELQEIGQSEAFFKLLTQIEKQQAFGLYANADETTADNGLYERILEQLQNYIDASTLNNVTVNSEDLYLFVENLSALKSNLNQVEQIILKSTPAGNVLLSGIFFLATWADQSNNSTYLFNRDLMQNVLSKQNIAPKFSALGVRRADFRSNVKLYSYYLIALIILIYIVVSFISTSTGLTRLLRAVPQHISYGDNFEKNLANIANYNGLMQEIIAFKHQWEIKVIPFHVGIIRVENRYSKAFVKQFRQNVLILFHQHLSEFLNNKQHGMTELEHAYVVENIVESINIIQAKLDGQSYSYLEKLDPPELEFLGFDESKDNILSTYGSLFRLYVWWESNPDTLRKEKGKLVEYLNSYKLLADEKELHWLVAWANTQSNIAPITLRDFWHGQSGDSQIQVEPAYTQEGNIRIKKLLKEINAALPGYLNLNLQESRFNTWYLYQRLDAWDNFASNFHRGEDTLAFKEQWDYFFDSTIMLTTKGPYYQLLDTLYNQFSELDIKNPPSWLSEIKNFYALLDFQVKKNAIDKADNVSKVTRSFLDNIITKPSVIRNRHSLSGIYEKDFDTELNAAQSFLNYQNELSTLYNSAAASKGASFSVAQGLFNSQDEKSSKDAEKINKANSSFIKMHNLLSTDQSENTIFWLLIRGPFDFYVDYINRQASCFAQQQWETKILKVTNGLSGNELTNTLFGQKGLAWNFVNHYLQPFLQISNNAFVPVVKYGHIFPFTDDFYNFINRGLTIQSVEREQKQFENYFNKNGGRLITITNAPTSVNNNAKALPYKVTLDSVCSNKALHLDGYNYTSSTQLQWKLGQCGPAVLKIYFKTFTLTKSFAGQFGFANFLGEYLQGAVQYTAKDFPEEQTNLRAYNIRWVQVNYHISGLSDLEYKLDNFFKLNKTLLENENKYLDQGNLPADITLCWQKGTKAYIYQQENQEIRKLLDGKTK